MALRQLFLMLGLFIITGCSGGGGGGVQGSGVEGGALAAPVIAGTAESQRISISWQDVSSAASYNIYWSTDASMTKATAHKEVASGSPFVHSGISTGTTYYYFLTFVSADGIESDISNKIEIQASAIPNLAPSASLDLPASAYRGNTVTIDASGSTDSDGEISTYAFDFGDGSPTSVQISPSAAHVFAKSGTFRVTLKVTDNRSSSTTIAKEITVGLVAQNVINVSATPTMSKEAVAAVDYNGKIGISWVEPGGVSFASSGTGGSVFDKKITWSNRSYKFDQPSIATSNGEFYFSWTVFTSPGAEIVFARSASGGQSFSAPVIVSTIDDINSYASSISVEGSNVIIAWSDIYTGIDPRPQGITYSRSTDGGSSFSPPTYLGPGIAPKVVLANGKTYLSWMTGDGSKILFTSSTDGITFAPVKQISMATQNVWIRAMQVDRDGRIYVTWTEGSAFSQKWAMLAVSSDGGATFLTPTVVSDPGLDCWANSLVVGPDGTIIILWSTGDAYNKPPYMAYLIYSLDHGATFTPAMRITTIDGQSGEASMVSTSSSSLGVFWANPLTLPPLSGTYVLPDILYSNIVVPH